MNNGVIIEAHLDEKACELLKKILKREENRKKRFKKINEKFKQEFERIKMRKHWVDEEVSEFCETHNVIDVKTYNGNHECEKEVVIQYK